MTSLGSSQVRPPPSHLLTLSDPGHCPVPWRAKPNLLSNPSVQRAETLGLRAANIDNRDLDRQTDGTVDS